MSILADQLSKIWVKINMKIGQEIPFLDWFEIYFIENNGMAYGIELEGTWGKLALTLFRIIAVSGIAYFLIRQIKQGVNRGFIISISLTRLTNVTSK